MKVWNIKPVFPLLYMSLFLTAIWFSIDMYMQQPPPELIGAVEGDSNKSVLVFFINGFAVALSVYIVTYYIFLEFLEHNGQYNAKNKSIHWWRRIVEVALRLLLAFIVALKVFKWSGFENLFAFVLVMTVVLAAWYWFVTFFLNIDGFQKDTAIFTAVIAALAAYGHWYALDPSRQLENSMTIFALVIITTVLVTLCLAHVWWKMGSEVAKIAFRFCTNW